MEIGLANALLNINIILGCISLVLNCYVLAVLIVREKRYRKVGNHEGGHLRGEKKRT